MDFVRNPIIIITQSTFRAIFDKQRQYVYEVFSALLYIVMLHTQPKSKVVIDKEYPGQEGLIKLLILKFYSEHKQTAPENIEFGLIGKTSSAHNLGYKIFKKQQKPSKVVHFKEILEIIFPTKKTGYSSISGTEGS